MILLPFLRWPRDTGDQLSDFPFCSRSPPRSEVRPPPDLGTLWKKGEPLVPKDF